MSGETRNALLLTAALQRAASERYPCTCATAWAERRLHRPGCPVSEGLDDALELAQRFAALAIVATFAAWLGDEGAELEAAMLCAETDGAAYALALVSWLHRMTGLTLEHLGDAVAGAGQAGLL